MAVPLAEVADVEAIWRALEPAESAQVARLIDVASAKLRQRCPFNVDARIALYTTDPTAVMALDPLIVANVVATVVKRVVVNPDGVASTSQAFGPISEQKYFLNRSESTKGEGDIVITKADIAELLPPHPTSKPRSLDLGLSQSMQGRRYRYWAPGAVPNPAATPQDGTYDPYWDRPFYDGGGNYDGGSWEGDRW